MMGERFRLVVWDLPGLGRSTRPATSEYSLEMMAQALDAILTFLGPRPVVLVGHSIGGMILLTLCRLFPDDAGSRVRGMVLAHTTYTNPVRTTAKHQLYTALQKPVLEPLVHLTIWLSPVLWLLNVLSYLNGSAHHSTARQSFAGTQTRQQVQFVTRCLLHTSPAVLARGMLGMLRYDATTTLPPSGSPCCSSRGPGHDDRPRREHVHAGVHSRGSAHHPDPRQTSGPARTPRAVRPGVVAFCEACLRPGKESL